MNMLAKLWLTDCSGSSWTARESFVSSLSSSSGPVSAARSGKGKSPRSSIIPNGFCCSAAEAAVPDAAGGSGLMPMSSFALSCRCFASICCPVWHNRSHEMSLSTAPVSSRSVAKRSSSTSTTVPGPRMESTTRSPAVKPAAGVGEAASCAKARTSRSTSLSKFCVEPAVLIRTDSCGSAASPSSECDRRGFLLTLRFLFFFAPPSSISSIKFTTSAFF
mmetsp:Transcript_8429/g.26733  ORF Transcript_8429/g.26733 Transcript_8429/m.26733 type:complete len:219 (+) Transcript_8429:333-989(+)